MIHEYIKPELDYFREVCNFSKDELTYFNCKAKKCTNREVAIKLNVSEPTVALIAKRVKDKINRAKAFKH